MNRRTPSWVPFIVGVALFLILGESTGAAASDRPIYRYADPNGTLFFTDDLSKIPPEQRSAAKRVELPPAIKIPEPTPPQTEKPSWPARTQAWYEGLPAEYQWALGGILPLTIMTVWVLSFLRKRSEPRVVKVLLRIAMMGVVVGSTYLCYFLIMRAQAAKLTGMIPTGSGLQTTPQQILEPLKKQESDRFKRLEDIADQK